MTRHEQRAARLTSIRNTKMARSAHAYVRGNTIKFYDWLESSGSKVPQGPAIWICGDCHLGEQPKKNNHRDRYPDQPDAIRRDAELLKSGGSLVSTIYAADEEWFAERQITAHNIASSANPSSSPQRNEVAHTSRMARSLRASAPWLNWTARASTLKTSKSQCAAEAPAGLTYRALLLLTVANANLIHYNVYRLNRVMTGLSA